MTIDLHSYLCQTRLFMTASLDVFAARIYAALIRSHTKAMNIDVIGLNTSC